MKRSAEKDILIIKGSLGNVGSWIEQEPYNAKKKYDDKYPYYHILSSQDVTTAAIKQIALLDPEKVWVETQPVFERDLPHPGYAGIAQLLSTSREARDQIVEGLCFGPSMIDNDDCHEFCLIQQDKLIANLTQKRKTAFLREVEAIREEIVHRGATAYAQYRPRLIEIINRVG